MSDNIKKLAETVQEYMKVVDEVVPDYIAIDPDHKFGKIDDKLRAVIQESNFENENENENENNLKTYRVTWRHEFCLKAQNDQEARTLWESVDLGNLDSFCPASTCYPYHGFVEEISFECITDDYRPVS